MPGWRFQHGDRPEAVREFSDREMADPDIYAKYWPQPVLDWLNEVHAYEALEAIADESPNIALHRYQIVDIPEERVL